MIEVSTDVLLGHFPAEAMQTFAMLLNLGLQEASQLEVIDDYRNYELYKR